MLRQSMPQAQLMTLHAPQMNPDLPCISFASLRDKVVQWPTNIKHLDDICVKGQLMHQRRLSRKCSFLDVASVATGAHTERDRLEVILKIIDDELSLEAVDAMRSQCKLGDIVRVRGFVECLEGGTSILLHARDIRVLRTWKEENPGITFLPLPTVIIAKKLQQVIPDEEHCKSSARSRGTLQMYRDDTSVTEGPDKRIHCKFWINSKTCQHSDKCEFYHVHDAERKTERAKWIKDRLHLKRVRAHMEDDPLNPHGKTGKQQRAQVFAAWLVETFGAEFLAAGKGIVDVAGGRGSVSFELWNKRNLPCTLVEPRPLKLSKQQHQYLKKQKQSWKKSRSVGSPLPQSLVPQITALFNMDTFLEQAENVQLLEQASFLLGMHPDEATECIIDVAIQFNKPFAVVPCCVFGHNFPGRRLSDGRKVLSYEDLVDYLISKHPAIEKAFLPFDGKNLVLFRRPSVQSHRPTGS